MMIVTLAFLMLAVIMIVPVSACSNSKTYYSHHSYDYNNCDNFPNLPTTTVEMTATGNDPTTYFMCNFTGVPKGYDITNIGYLGWCGDQATHMDRGVPHTFALYSTSNPPSELDNINWNAVNYILNHKNGTLVEIQFAIWYFTNDYPSLGQSPYTDSMIAAALANPNYVPTKGEIIGVLCVPVDEPNAQLTIIELKITCQSGCGTNTHGGCGSFNDNGCYYWNKNSWHSWSSHDCYSRNNNDWYTGHNSYSSGCFSGWR
jgi:hypothetical protein